MLNGKYPLVVFYFYADSNRLIPQAIPIPLYLDEQMTGLALKGSSMTATIMTEQMGDDVFQKAMENTLSINFESVDDTSGMAILKAMMFKLIEYMGQRKYSISYFDGSSVILDAVISDYTLTKQDNSNKYDVNIKLAKRPAITTNLSSSIVPTTGNANWVGV